MLADPAGELTTLPKPPNREGNPSHHKFLATPLMMMTVDNADDQTDYVCAEGEGSAMVLGWLTITSKLLAEYSSYVRYMAGELTRTMSSEYPSKSLRLLNGSPRAVPAV